MDATLYKAIMEGKDEELDRYSSHALEVQLTPIRNTILHEAAYFGHTRCVIKILDKCPWLVGEVNIKGETPLHMAVVASRVSRYKESTDIVRAIIECAKGLFGIDKALEILRATNKDGDTVLHMTVRRVRNEEIVRLLTEEDPEFQHPRNNARETPLYLAAERGYVEYMEEILKNCKFPTYGGPFGQTALHAAAAASYYYSGLKCLNLLLDHNYGALITVGDEYGWTPLHYAARSGSPTCVERLIIADKSATYITTKNADNNTPLHLAAAGGGADVVEMLLLYCPDCWQIINAKGQNFLHIAMEMEQDKVVTYVMSLPIFSLLINQKDKEGNTPVHQVATYKENLGLIEHWREMDDFAFNNEMLTANDMICRRQTGSPFDENNWHGTLRYHGWRNIAKDDINNIKKHMKNREARKKGDEQTNKEIERLRKIGDTHMIVATLITTIAFAASFTVPGGYDGNQGPNQGLAVLVRKAAFKAFVISNSIALVTSLSSVVLYVTASLYYRSDGGKDTEDKLTNRYLAALFLVMIAIAAMLIVFITGSYAVFGQSRGLAIFIVAIGCFPLSIYFREIKRGLEILTEG